MRNLIFVLIMVASTAQAKGRSKTEVIYIVDGKQVSAVEAMEAAMRRGPVMKCQSVELKPSKSGTSFSLRAVKRGE